MITGKRQTSFAEAVNTEKQFSAERTLIHLEYVWKKTDRFTFDSDINLRHARKRKIIKSEHRTIPAQII